MQNIHWQLLDSWHCMRDEADTDTDRAERGRGAEIGLTSPWVIGALSRRLLLLALARSLWNEYCTSICHSFWTYLKMTFNIYFFFHSIPAYGYVHICIYGHNCHFGRLRAGWFKEHKATTPSTVWGNLGNNSSSSSSGDTHKSDSIEAISV